MSISVPVDELPDRIAEYGTLAFLVTVGEDRRAHVVSVRVDAAGGGRLRTGAGRMSRANLTAGSGATLVWPPGPDGRYSLIVDARPAGSVDGDGPVDLDALSGVLHVLARPDAVPGQPRC